MPTYTSHSFDEETKNELLEIGRKLGVDSTVPAAVRALIRYYKRKESEINAKVDTGIKERL